MIRWRVGMVALVGTLAVIVTPIITYAGKPSTNKVDRSSHITATLTGNDISWPQCSRLKSLPTGQAFGIVGVDGSRANTANPCLSSELTWASKSTGATAQPKTALYANTGNPGDITPALADWPTNNRDLINPTVIDTDPYGTCKGTNDAACAWQYGYNMANSDATTRGVTTPAAYKWYLDVETSNSWSADTADNAADLEGMVTYFKSIGVAVGLYSTRYQWNIIVGDYGVAPDAGGNNLDGLASWLPGYSTQASAQAACAQPPLTVGSKVALAQYTSGQFDYDVICP